MDSVGAGGPGARKGLLSLLASDAPVSALPPAGVLKSSFDDDSDDGDDDDPVAPAPAPLALHGGSSPAFWRRNGKVEAWSARAVQAEKMRRVLGMLLLFFASKSPFLPPSLHLKGRERMWRLGGVRGREKRSAAGRARVAGMWALQALQLHTVSTTTRRTAHLLTQRCLLPHTVQCLLQVLIRCTPSCCIRPPFRRTAFVAAAQAAATRPPTRATASATASATTTRQATPCRNAVAFTLRSSCGSNTPPHTRSGF